MSTAATSWYEEFRRLYDMVPCVEVQTLKEHTDQVLHLSFSHSGYQFASCSKDCTVKVRVPLPCSRTQWEEKPVVREVERATQDQKLRRALTSSSKGQPSILVRCHKSGW